MTLSQLNTLPDWQRYGAIARVLVGGQADKWADAERKAINAENMTRANAHLGPMAGKDGR